MRPLVYKTVIRPFSHFVILTLICTSIHQCSQSGADKFEALMDYAGQVKVINTHEHQHWPEEYGKLNYRLPHLIQASYLNSDIVSAGGTYMNWEDLDKLDNEAYLAINGAALDYTRNTSYYSHFVEGFRKLHGFSDPYFTAENFENLSARVEEKYADYRLWFDEAFHRGGFELMFLDQYWKPFNTEVAREYYALVFHINPLVMHASGRPAEGQQGPGIFQKAREEGYAMKSLDDYLVYCEVLFQENIKYNAVCVKNSMAYSRSLDYEKVSFDEASRLFDRKSADLTNHEAKKIQDFMFHWIIQKSIGYDLPIQIHTGYLAGNGNTLDNGKPVKLNPLFLLYPEAKFVLFHGGYPWTGEYAALGKMFPNVYLDLVWLPQISRQEAVQALEEMFDAVPYNKFFWGGDCSFIEESTGSLEFGKSVVAEVLSNRMKRGLLTEEVARDMITHIFRTNAIEVFQLESRLGRSFQ